MTPFSGLTPAGGVPSDRGDASVRVLVLGGARSGKSGHAEARAARLSRGGAVRYIATAVPAGIDDPEWTARLRAHRERRPAAWPVIETALPGSPGLPALLREPIDPALATLVDDLGTWLSATLDAAGAWDGPDAATAADELATDLVDAVRSHDGDLVLVSPEVGMGVVPAHPSGRVFRDAIGRLNARLAEICDEVVLVVAGRALPLPSADTAPVSDTAPPSPAPAVASAAAAPDTADHRDEPGDPMTDPLTFPPLVMPSAAAAAAASSRQLLLTKPAGSLGRLESIAAWVAACQDACPPRPVVDPRIVVFAGDHGVARHGVSAFPVEVTLQMVANIQAGGAAINVLARAAGASVRVLDISVDADCGPGAVSARKVMRSCGSIDREDAMSDEQVRAAIAAGRAAADAEVDSGADLLIAGDLGIGNTTPAAVLVGVVTDTEPVRVVGRGTGIDDAGWARKCTAVRDAMFRGAGFVRQPVELLRTVGSPDLAAMAGFLAQGAVRRTPVLLDGLVVTAAALVAEELAPGAHRWWAAGHRSAEPAHTAALDHLQLEPLIDGYEMRLGEGSGAALALPMVKAAVLALCEMATFTDAGVSEKVAETEAPGPDVDAPSATEPRAETVSTTSDDTAG